MFWIALGGLATLLGLAGLGLAGWCSYKASGRGASHNSLWNWDFLQLLDLFDLF